jgi:hypothetical protein
LVEQVRVYTSVGVVFLRVASEPSPVSLEGVVADDSRGLLESTMSVGSYCPTHKTHALLSPKVSFPVPNGLPSAGTSG